MILQIPEVVELLLCEKLVAIPTETVYGLAGLAESKKAISQIYQVKNRPTDNPLICHFDGLEMLAEYVPNIPDYAQILLEKLTPGPISFLFKIPDGSPLLPATGGRNTAVIRIPNHPIAIEIIKQTGKPLAAPSANTSGKFSPTSALMVEKDLGDKIAGIVDGGGSEIGLESTIIDCTKPNSVQILRQGAIGFLEIQNILGKFDLKTEIFDYKSEQSLHTVPGSKYKHYAPKTPVTQIQNLDQINTNTPFALLASDQKLTEIKVELGQKFNAKLKIELINLGKNITEISHNLYQKLFELDQKNIAKAYLLKENYGQSSLAKALQDKLNRILENNNS